MSDVYEAVYNPDVLECIANLSNDEVFTPPEVANAMLDLLPQALFFDPNTKFLDPACKSGVFLREIAKRLLTGLEDKIPDLQERVDHIFKNQIYGIAITELTSLLSRRSVYCCKYADNKYSVTKFDTLQGNIFFEEGKHLFVGGKCLHCGIGEQSFKEQFTDKEEKHAYQFIHNLMPGELENMKFDVIIGNPPYQMSTGSDSAQAIPLYNKFVTQAKKLNPKYLCMIIPSRWYAGGMGLDDFRNEMLNDDRISVLVDYPNAEDCFPGIQLRGGACYFLWDQNYHGKCEITNISGKIMDTVIREKNEFSVFIRWNKAIKILAKILSKEEPSMSEIISQTSPFGIGTSIRGQDSVFEGSFKLHSSKGVSYISEVDIKNGKNLINKYKVLFSRPISGNMEVPPFKVIALMKVLGPKEVCTHTYLVAGAYEEYKMAENLESYLKTKFLRFLLSLSISGMDISREKFRFVPLQDFSKPWTDAELYEKYNLSQEEIGFIESMIRPME